MKRRLPLLIVLAAAAVAWWYTHREPTSLVLTGIVTTHHVVVSPQVTGRVARLLVKEGDTVAKDQLVAVLQPDELREERDFYSHTADGVASQIREGEVAVRWQERQSRDQIAQAEATLAATQSQRAAADAELENARVTLDRTQRMVTQGASTAEQLDQARTNFEVAKSRIAALLKQIDAQHATVALARSSADQIAIRRSQLSGTRQQQSAAAAQRAKADVRLAYTEIHAPLAGTVDVRAAREGEVVTPGQPVLTLINQDDLWVRADVEESYIDRVRVGDTLTVRLPSGAERAGVVFFRGVDAAFATQRDVSRTKRDIKTFEIRLRLDNKDRSLAVGMTAYVLMPLSMTTAIDVRQIVKTFGDFTAVNGISFDVDAGEIFGLLGPNGAGKSTLIRMMTTLLPPTAGTALINGFDVVKQSDHVRQSIGVIPQAMTSDLELSVEENLLIFAKLYGVPRDKRTRLIHDLLAAVELLEWRDKPVRNLSGGMRRRVEIARGLVHEPKVFFLDEPTTGLDPVSRTAVWEMLQKIKQERDLTVLITTHYMDEADKLCDRIAIVDHGKLAALDSPMKLKASVPGKNVVEASFSPVPEGWDRTLATLTDVESVVNEGNVFKLASANGPATTLALLEAAARAGTAVQSLSVQSTTLDDVFVHYTGRALRDALQAPSAADSPFMLRR